MAYMELNGVPIPVAKCEASTQEIGERDRVFSGQYSLVRRAVKRVWKVSTAPMLPSLARSVIGMVSGAGHCWRFDDETLYSFKGRTLDASGSRFTAIGDMAETLADRVGSYVIPYGRVSTDTEIEPKRHSICCDRPSTNVLGAAQRKIAAGSAAAGFTAMDGAVITDDTDHSWAGSYGLKVVTSAVVNGTRGGVYSNGVATSGTMFVTGSVWLYSEETTEADRTLYLHVSDNTHSATSDFVTVTIPQNQWTRVTIPSFYITLAAASVSIVVREFTADSGITFWCDGFQLEQSATERGSTAWVDGARASVDLIRFDNVNYLGAGAGDFTFNAWVSNSQLGASQNARWLFDIMPSAAIGSVLPRVYCYRNSEATPTLRFGLTNAAGEGRTIIAAWDPYLGDGYDVGQLSMVTVVIRRDPGVGEHEFEAWINGTLTGYDDDTTTMPDLRTLGNNKGRGWLGTQYYEAAAWGGAIDDFAILPFAADATTIAGWYARGQYSDVPKYVLSGDVVGGDEVSVVGEFLASTNRPFRSAGTWINNGCVVSFNLMEV